MTTIEAVRAAADRLAHRLRYRETTRAGLEGCSPAVPLWWKEGLSNAAIFGDGHISLPSVEPDLLSRPVSFLMTSEISVTAGGDYVPIAWIDGGERTALVHDHGELAVVLVEPGTGGAAVTVSPSLVEFLDSLRPQSLCRLAEGEETMSIELRSEHVVLTEHQGVVARHEMHDSGELGEFVATFIRQGLEAGLRPRFCPANLWPIIETYLDVIGGGELPPEQHASAVIERLLRGGELLLIEGHDIEDLVDGAARFLENPIKNGVTVTLARRFSDWLLEQPSVDEIYADDETLIKVLKYPDLMKHS